MKTHTSIPQIKKMTNHHASDWARLNRSLIIEERTGYFQALYKDSKHMNFERLNYQVSNLNRRIGYVYFMECVELSLVKIGMSRKPINKRTDVYKTESPILLKRSAVIWCYISLEKILHKILDKYRHHNEWFIVNNLSMKLLQDFIVGWKSFLCLVDFSCGEVASVISGAFSLRCASGNVIDVTQTKQVSP